LVFPGQRLDVVADIEKCPQYAAIRQNDRIFKFSSPASLANGATPSYRTG
jgi:hypothetical protein